MTISPETWNDPDRLAASGTADMLMVALERVREAEAELAVREAEHAANVARIEGLEEEFISRGLRLDALEAGFTAAQSELEAIQEDLATLETEVAENGSDIGTHTSQIANLTSRVTALEGRMTTAESQIASNSSSIVTINTRLGLVNAVLHLW